VENAWIVMAVFSLRRFKRRSSRGLDAVAGRLE
jgi:hypothetical protein